MAEQPYIKNVIVEFEEDVRERVRGPDIPNSVRINYVSRLVARRRVRLVIRVELDVESTARSLGRKARGNASKIARDGMTSAKVIEESVVWEKPV